MGYADRPTSGLFTTLDMKPLFHKITVDRFFTQNAPIINTDWQVSAEKFKNLLMAA